jgi:hypothetical protein
MILLWSCRYSVVKPTASFWTRRICVNVHITGKARPNSTGLEDVVKE